MELHHRVEQLTHYKNQIAMQASIKYRCKHAPEDDSLWTPAEYDRACRALKFYRAVYRYTCIKIHALIPYR